MAPSTSRRESSKYNGEKVSPSVDGSFCSLQNVAETVVLRERRSGGVKIGQFGGAAAKNDNCHLTEPRAIFFG
jgi:hypothetical protein